MDSRTSVTAWRNSGSFGFRFLTISRTSWTRAIGISFLQVIYLVGKQKDGARCRVKPVLLSLNIKELPQLMHQWLRLASAAFLLRRKTRDLKFYPGKTTL